MQETPQIAGYIKRDKNAPKFPPMPEVGDVFQFHGMMWELQYVNLGKMRFTFKPVGLPGT